MLKKNITIFIKNIFAAISISFLWACNATPPQQPYVSKVFTPTVITSATYTALPSETPSPTTPATYTAIPSKIPSPTTIPTLDGTPVPTLVAHQWISSKPLITFGTYGGDGSCGPSYPDFTLLPDGQLFFIKFEQDTWSIQTTKLSSQDTCKLLNSIDQAGFFDYDPSTYISDPQSWPPIMGAETTYISVQAWRSKSIKLYGLSDFMYDYETGCADCQNSGFPTLLPSLRNTYRLLKSYQPVNAEVYKSDRLGVWINPGYGGGNIAVPWPVKSISLSKIASQAGNASKPDIILTGEDAAIVFQLFIQNSGLCSANFTEGDKVYEIAARYLLPYEYQSSMPVPKTLSCSPDDGWIEVP